MKYYVAIDVGCHECGVGSEVIGTFLSQDAAKYACELKTKEHKNWRDGGQTIPEVFEIDIPES